MTPWLTIIGMGEDGFEALSLAAKLALEQAQVIIGTARLFEKLPALLAQKEEWPQPFSRTISQILNHKGKATVLLATGDPMNFGVARKVFEFIAKSEVTVIPHLSAFSLTAAQMGWSLPDCDCLTIHGRPAANLEVFIQPGVRLLVLTQDETSIAEICRRLISRGFEHSTVTVLENLGGPNQRITSFAAHNNPGLEWSPLNTIAIDCVAGSQAQILSRLPGLPEEAFVHDGQITKREVRAMTIAALAPAPDQLLWDVGAGCGSIAIEWLRSTRGTKAIAIEPDAKRQEMIAQNAEALGVPHLQLISAAAPQAYALPPSHAGGRGRAATDGSLTAKPELTNLPESNVTKLPIRPSGTFPLRGKGEMPDAIFIGGGISDEEVFEGAWAALRSGGNLVANVVTLEGDARLIGLQKTYGGDLVRMDVSTLTQVGDLRALRPRMSVLQWRVKKP
jgi:precorrin-6Y C5,15-methyltransferase (decarboxylating)